MANNDICEKEMNNIQQLLNHENKNVKLFVSTIENLRHSQGFYGRLHRHISTMSQEELDELINTLCEQDFKHSLDVILWLEA